MSALSKLLILIIILVENLCMNDESDVLKQGCTHLQILLFYFIFFSENFYTVCDSLVSADMENLDI